MIDDDNKPVNYKPHFNDEVEIEQQTKAKNFISEGLFIPTWDNKPPYKEPVLLLNKQSILSFQNLSCLIASPGLGKSSTMEAICSCVINPNSDNLYFSTNAKRVLYIDFERTELDVWNSFYRVMKRAEISKGIEVENVRIVSLRRTPTADERKQLIENLIIEFKPDLLLLDGIGDLVDDTNSLPEAIQCKVWVRRITSKYSLSILTTLHPNKGTVNPRGHIGSEMLRECENILLIKIVDNDVRLITTDFEHGKARNSGHANGSFKWCNDKKMFVSTPIVITRTENEAPGYRKTQPHQISKQAYIELINIIFEQNTELGYKDLIAELKLQINKNLQIQFGDTKIREVVTHLKNENLIAQNGTPGTKSCVYFKCELEPKEEHQEQPKIEQTTLDL